MGYWFIDISQEAAIRNGQGPRDSLDYQLSPGSCYLSHNAVPSDVLQSN